MSAFTGIRKNYTSGRQVRWMMSPCFCSAVTAVSGLAHFPLSYHYLILLVACGRRCLHRLPQDQVPHPRKDKLGTQVPSKPTSRSTERTSAKETIDRISRTMDGDGPCHPWEITS